MTISLDLIDFFDTVRPAMLNGRIPGIAHEKCFPDGAARQGLPTSPAIANLAAGTMDEAIRKRLAKLQISGWVYTRYADDLSISCDSDNQELAEKIISEIKIIVSRCGFKLNVKKTRIQRAKGGRREICGLTVDEAVRVPRRILRKIRAARHEYGIAIHAGDMKKAARHERSLCGLLEFSQLKEPRPKTETEKKESVRLAEAKKIAAEYNLKSPLPCEKILQDEKLGDNMYITCDPSMMYGMSAYTSGWTSCMSITRSEHSYRKGVTFWQRLKGVSLAYIASGHIMKIAGVERTRMSARCLVFALRDGRKAYGDIYSERGHSLDTSHPLAKKLETIGFIPAHGCGELVEGNVVQPCPLPFFDNANVETITLAESKRKAYRIRLR